MFNLIGGQLSRISVRVSREWAFSYFQLAIHRTDLLEVKQEVLPNDQLTIRCEIEELVSKYKVFSS